MNWLPIIGVLVGFLLSQFANLMSWWISERRLKKLIRVLIGVEIDQNLALLRDYWHNVSLPPDDDPDEETPNVKEVEADRLARRAVEIPLSSLSNKAFDSQLGSLPKVLSEEEIRLTWQVYEEFSQIQSLRDWLIEVASKGTAEKEAFPSASRVIRADGLHSATFTTRRAGAIYDLRVTIQKLLKAGNPLKQ
jgi:hypothetical protein